MNTAHMHDRGTQRIMADMNADAVMNRTVSALVSTYGAADVLRAIGRRRPDVRGCTSHCETAAELVEKHDAVYAERCKQVDGMLVRSVWGERREGRPVQ